MAREIKYQAWDTEDKRMIEWQELLDYGSGLAEYFQNPRELVFREFTGLKDKTGKEIYEGDIWERRGFRGEVTFKYAQWCFVKIPSSDSYEYPHFFCNAKTGEVIGNIYSNPELLKEG